MGFYEKFTSLEWKETEYTDEVFSPESPDPSFISLAKRFNMGQNLFSVTCPQICEGTNSCMIIGVSDEKIEICLAVPEKPAFFASNPKNFLDSSIIGFIRMCTDFLFSENEEFEEEITIDSDEKPPREFYHDFWRSKYGEKRLRIEKINNFIGDKFPSVVLAFPSSDGGVWSSFLMRDSSGGYSSNISKQTATHFRQSFFRLLPLIFS